MGGRPTHAKAAKEWKPTFKLPAKFNRTGVTAGSFKARQSIGGEIKMKLSRLAIILALPTALLSGNVASAKGCLRGALVGGVAGHYAHHHAVAGAVAGCAAGHMYYKHKAHQAAHR